MPIESASYVSQLNASNPASGDAMGQGDDQIRLIKQTLVASFPAVAGAVTASHTELNHTDGVTSNIQTQLNEKLSKAGGTTTGIVYMNPGDSWHAKAAASGPNATGLVVNDGTDTRQMGVGGLFEGGVLSYAYVGAGASPWSNGLAIYASGAATLPGSLTAAGLVYGRGGGAGLGQITISTSAPSGGADGDLWMVVA